MENKNSPATKKGGEKGGGVGKGSKGERKEEGKESKESKVEEESPEEKAMARRHMLILEGLLVPAEPSCNECAAIGKFPEVRMDQAGGIYVCTECGLQLGSQIISGDTEWRSFEDDGHSSNKVDPNRVGGPEDDLFADMGLSTMIAGDTTMGRQQNKEALSGIQKSLTDGFKRIDYFSATLSLPKSILDNAKHLYKRIEMGELEMKKIRKKDTLVVVCIKFACTNMNVPRTFKELSEVTSIPEREVKRAYTRIKGAMARGDRKSTRSAAPIVATAPMQLLIPKISMLKLNIAIERAAAEVIEKAVKSNKLGSTTAASIVGAAIYKVTQASSNKEDRRSLADIASVMHLSAGTIRSVCNKF